MRAKNAAKQGQQSRGPVVEKLLQIVPLKLIFLACIYQRTCQLYLHVSCMAT